MNSLFRKTLISLCLICLQALVSICFAQKTDKYLQIFPQRDDTLYYIASKEKFQNKDLKCELNYEIIFETKEDSLHLMFSYLDKSALNIDSIAFVQEDMYFSAPANKIFVSMKNKSKRESRYEALFPITFATLYNKRDKTPIVRLYTERKIINLHIKKNDWKKESNLFAVIFQEINLLP